jgi:hypothetical protein
MDQKGWREDLADRANAYLQHAQTKSPKDSRVLSGREAFQRVAGKYGIKS